MDGDGLEGSSEGADAGKRCLGDETFSFSTFEILRLPGASTPHDKNIFAIRDVGRVSRTSWLPSELIRESSFASSRATAPPACSRS
jgi:hypothetical protein